MSINYSSSDLPETLWWAQQQHHQHLHHHRNNDMEPNTTDFCGNSHQLYHPIPTAHPHNSSPLNLDLNNDDDDEVITEDAERETEIQVVPKEPMFEKPLTPSDVGKLNRLVIPKQHAEKYFPLTGGNNNNDSVGGGEKGLLLNFEDESGKPWRFRYSYWNSSQSYVLTKGWSRFVKEKSLDAGDIVLFERHRLDSDRLFIGWRRRRSAAGGAAAAQGSTTAVGGGGGWTRMYFPVGHHTHPASHHHHHDGHLPAFPYQQPDCLHAEAAATAGVLQNQTRTRSANSKRLRLFGVNLECQQQEPDEHSESSSEPPTPPEGSGQVQAQTQFQYYPYFNHHNHHQMDINFSRDVNQTRYRQG
ncbi:hypothetical protein ACH5RR_004529 [Cinchona calisaya]|uniref:TF-B3 domain-containing protein n=1 Tax=Cinchona calisaya TaxID=153742 RepID=A0ABD3AY71_9GENT